MNHKLPIGFPRCCNHLKPGDIIKYAVYNQTFIFSKIAYSTDNNFIIAIRQDDSEVFLHERHGKEIEKIIKAHK